MAKDKAKTLFEDDDASDSSSSNDDDDDEQKERLVVNKKFAKAYQSRKQLEELRTARNSDDDSSSDDESEDEDGELLTPALDVSILKTINALRSKDSSIYDPKSTFFKEGDEDAAVAKKKSTKKKHFKDVLREQLLDDMKGKSSNNDDDDDQKMSKFEYDEEQKNLRSAFLINDDEDDENSEDDLLVVKTKAKPVDDEKTELELQAELKLMQETSTNDLKDPHGEVKDGDKFLLDFIKNRKWKDQDDDSSSDDDDDDKPRQKDNDDDSIDEVDRADNFEAKYNFRFEEAQTEVKSGADFSVMQYARSGTMDTLRRKDDSRKQKRLERKDRKAAERKAKEEQLRRLKNAKREEMEQKLKQIKQVVLGNSEDGELDEEAMMKLMEGDYDPDKFEQMMQKAYGDDFYANEDAEWKSDAQVRESLLKDEDGVMLVGQDDADGGLYDMNDDDENDGDEEEGDAEYVGEDDDNAGDYDDDELALPAAASKVEQKLHSKMQEELYKLDYEDIVAGMPTRFKYRQVPANSFGLSAQEILMARDTTLKNFVSLKRLAPYTEAEDEPTVGHKKRRRFREMLKADLELEATAKAVQEEEEQAAEQESSKKKRRRQKKGKKKELSQQDDVEDQAIEEEEDVTKDADSGKKKRRKKKGRKAEKVENDVDEGDVEETKTVAVEEIDTNMETLEEEEKKSKSSKDPDSSSKKKKKKQKKEKKPVYEGVPLSRLSAYGL